MRKNKKICFISSAGGHLEQLRQLSIVAQKYEHYYVLPKNNSTLKFNEKKYFVANVCRTNTFIFIIQLLFTFFQQIVIFIKERPDVVITTGAGVAYPTCLLAKLFRKKIIYIESFARMKSLNVTGQKLLPIADMFVVQWPELLKLAPNAVYGGWIY